MPRAVPVAPSAIVPPVASAVVGEVASKRTNRVVLQRQRKTPKLVEQVIVAGTKKPRKVITHTTARDADLSVRGKPYTVVCISIPIEHLAAIDTLATKLRTSRSALLRNAAMELAERTK